MGLVSALLVGFVQPCAAQRPAQGPMSDKVYTPGELGYELVWADEFDGRELDAQKWEVRGIGPRALGYVSPEAVKVEGGLLKLSAIQKDGKILLGAFREKKPFTFRRKEHLPASRWDRNPPRNSRV